MTKNSFAALILALTLIALFQAACDRSQSHGGPDSDRQTLYVGLSVPPTNLDPRWASDANSQRIDDLIFSSLVRKGNDLLPKAQAAESWTVEPKKITFLLRKDLKFSDGQPIDARDIIFSIREYQKPGSPFASTLQAVESVEAAGPYEIIFKLRENDGSLLINLDNIKILPEKEIEKWGDRFAEHLKGSGPYTLAGQDKNQLVLAKSLYQSYARPQTENIIFKFVRDENTRYLKMIKGDLDFLLNELAEEKIGALKKTGQVNIIVTPGLNFNYLLFNLRDPALKNKNLRQAFFAAVNRDDIVRYKLENLAVLATTIIAPPSPFSDSNLDLPKKSLTEAKAIVKNLGLEGQKFTIETSDQAVDNGLILAQQLEVLGIKVSVKSFEWGTFYSDLKMGRFQMATSRWVGIVDPDIYRESLDSHEFPPGHNRGFYENKEFDSLVEEGRSKMNLAERQKCYFKAEKIVAAELPIIPLWYNSNVSVLSLRIKDFIPASTGSFYPLIDARKD